MSATVVLVLASGCADVQTIQAPGSFRRVVEPELGGEYELYVPARYDRNLSWPLLVLCSAGGFDTPAKQLRAWAPYAEERGLIVAAPRLKARPHKSLSPLEAARTRILATLRHVQAGHNISRDRILMQGRAKGALPALFVGLSEPEVFRAIAIVSPDVKVEELMAASARIDPHQPVYFQYAISDAVTGRTARLCLDWLRSHRVEVIDNPLGSSRAKDMAPVLRFFEDVLRKSPWVIVRAAPTGGQQLEVRFEVRTSFAPRGFRWDFGDGDRANVAEPIHLYKNPGTYRVLLELDGAGKEPVVRAYDLLVPEMALRHALSPPASR